MDTDLHSITTALAKLRDIELHALITCSNEAPQIAPGLLAWIEHGADWEIHRRNGQDLYLQPPEAAIDASEDAASVVAALMLRQQFEQDAPDVAALFDAIVGALGGGEGRH